MTITWLMGPKGLSSASMGAELVGRAKANIAETASARSKKARRRGVAPQVGIGCGEFRSMISWSSLSKIGTTRALRIDASACVASPGVASVLSARMHPPRDSLDQPVAGRTSNPFVPKNDATLLGRWYEAAREAHPWSLAWAHYGAGGRRRL